MLFAGPLDGPTRRHDVGDQLPKDSVAATVVQWDKKRALLTVNAVGKGSAMYLELGSKSGRAIAGQVALQTKVPLQSLTTLAAAAGNILLAAADGHIVEFAPGPINTWSETHRWNSWADGKDSFGPKIYAALSKRHLWVSDSANHRVLCFDLAGDKPALTATFGANGESGDALTSLNAPQTIAANGNRAVVFDSGNQRIVRLELATQ